MLEIRINRLGGASLEIIKNKSVEYIKKNKRQTQIRFCKEVFGRKRRREPREGRNL